MRDEDPAGQLEDRREELEQADRGQRQLVGAGGEADQRDHGHQSGRGQQYGHMPGGVSEHGPVVGLKVGQVGERGQELEGGLDRHRRHGRHSGEFLAQAVGAERGGQDQRDPRRPAVGHGQFHHGGPADGHRHPLQSAQLLVQDEDAEQDGEQRVDEVAEGGLDHLARVDRPDVDAPVDRDDRGGDGQQRDLPRLGAQLREPAPVPGHGQQDRDRDERPEHPVGQDLQGAGRFEQRPVQGEQAPHSVGGYPGYQPALLLCHGRYLSQTLTGNQ